MNNFVYKKYLDIYSQDIKICFTKKAIVKLINKNESDEKTINDVAGLVYRTDECIHIYIKEVDGDIDMNTISHESFHAADFIGEKVGLEYSEGTGNEHYAYLIGIITTMIVDAFNIYMRVKK